jgi:ribosomal protein S18 acetylase RimI-like enzyme
MVPLTSVPFTLRPLTARDAPAARALADAVLADAPYDDQLRGAIDRVLASRTDEYRALVAVADTALAGLLVFGETAGARGAGHIYFVAVDASTRRRGIATALAEAACRDLTERGARFVIIEMPDDPRLAGARLAAEQASFREEGRIADYVSDGMSLLLLRRDCGDGGSPR